MSFQVLLSKSVIPAQLSNEVFCRIVAFQPFNHFIRFLFYVAVPCISSIEILLQMAETPNIRWDREGHAHTNALHWEGFPVSCGSHFKFLAMTHPHVMTDMSLLKRVFLGVG
jgi:hypothetical protein